MFQYQDFDPCCVEITAVSSETTDILLTSSSHKQNVLIDVHCGIDVVYGCSRSLTIAQTLKSVSIYDIMADDHCQHFQQSGDRERSYGN